MFGRSKQKKQLRKITALLLFILMVTPTLGFAKTSRKAFFQSKDSQTILLELYTSEGCSSCPPAERWFTRLRKSPRLWKSYVPVAFHVDYWNNLGWTDSFSKAQFTTRQRSYAKLWRARTIYTPGIVLDGRAWKQWRPSDDVPVAPGGGAGDLIVRGQGSGSFSIKYKEGEIRLDECYAQAAILGFDIVEKIQAGENSGLTLVHDFTVLSLEEIRLEKAGKNTYQGVLEFSDDLSSFGPGLGLAVWVTGEDRLASIQATGGYLPD